MVQARVDKQSLSFIRLRSTYSIKEFDCGDKDLNDFMLNRATLFDKYRLSVSYACSVSKWRFQVSPWYKSCNGAHSS